MSLSATVYDVISNQSVASSGTSVASTAFPDGTEAVRLVSSEDAFVVFAPLTGAGTTPTAASTTGFFLQSDLPEYFKAKPGGKLAVIQDSAAGTVRVAHLARN